MFIKNKKGFSIIEVLIAVGILSVVNVALFKIMDISVLSSSLSNSIMTDADLKMAIHNVLKPDQCEVNLKPSNIDSTHKTISELKKYSDPADLTTGLVLLKSGASFRDYLDIVRIELADLAPPIPKQKEFKVYYKRNRVRHLNKKGNLPCNSTDQSGCYINKCKIEYEVSGSDVVKCTVLDCFGVVQNLSSNGNLQEGCYQINSSSVIIGCSPNEVGGINTTAIGNGVLETGTIHSEAIGNTFIGGFAGRHSWLSEKAHFNNFLSYSAGAFAQVYTPRNVFIGVDSGIKAVINSVPDPNTGSKLGRNIFFGYRTGEEGKIFSHDNTFIGTEAGKEINLNPDKTQYTGYGNTFIGMHSGKKATVKTNKNVNIGNSVLMKSRDVELDPSAYDVPNGEVWITGKLKVCNENGKAASCREVTPSGSESGDIQALKNHIKALEERIETLENR